MIAAFALNRTMLLKEQRLKLLIAATALPYGDALAAQQSRTNNARVLTFSPRAVATAPLIP